MQIFTIADLVNRWHVHEVTIRRMLERGELPGFKIGNRWRITADTVSAYERGALPSQS